MSKDLDLGRVRGYNATINGHNGVLLSPQDGVEGSHLGTKLTISSPAMVTHPTLHNNPHNITKSHVGLGSVDNISENTIIADAKDSLMTADNISDALGYTPLSNDDVGDYENKITGTPDQTLGFDTEGNLIPVTRTDLIYGFEIDINESNPASKVKYLARNSTYEPAKMNYSTGVFDYGDWNDIWFIKGIKPRIMNRDGSVYCDIDPNNYNTKILPDGTKESILPEERNTIMAAGGQWMVGIPTVWVKIDDSIENKIRVYVSPYKAGADYHAWAHTNIIGEIMPYTYLGMYLGSSLTIADPTGGELDIYTSRPGVGVDKMTSAYRVMTDARNINSDHDEIWDMAVFSDRMLLNILLILISRSTDLETSFGKGLNANTLTTDTLTTGAADTAGLFKGYTVDTNYVKVFGIENPWGFLGEYTLGILMDDMYNLKAKLTRGKWDGSTVNDYDIHDYDGYLDIGTVGGITADPMEDEEFTGFIKDMKATMHGLFPINISGASNSTYYCSPIKVPVDSDSDTAIFGGPVVSGDTRSYPLGCTLYSGSTRFASRISLKPYNKSAPKTGVFGLTIYATTGTEPKIITYSGDNRRFNPAHMDFDNNRFDYGDWADAWFIKDLKPRVMNRDGTIRYELDKNDYSCRILEDGTSVRLTQTEVATAKAECAQWMVGIPTVWVKISHTRGINMTDDNKAEIVYTKNEIFLSPTKIDDTYHAWAHMDAHGDIIPYTYISAFPASYGRIDADYDTLISHGGELIAKQLTLSEAIEKARKNNQGLNKHIWDMSVFSDRMLYTLILMMIGKTDNIPDIFGDGVNDITGAAGTNIGSSRGLFWGARTADNPLFVKALGIEDMWGAIGNLTLGAFVDADSTFKVKLTKSLADGSSVEDYSIDDSAGYLTANQITMNNDPLPNEVVNSSFKHWNGFKGGLYPLETGGSTVSYDALYKFNSGSTALHGPVLFGFDKVSPYGHSPLTMMAYTVPNYRGTHISLKPYLHDEPDPTPPEPTPTGEFYGFEIDQTKSAPDEMISYFGDNENFEKAYMDLSWEEFNYGDWADAWFIKDLKPCIVNLDGTIYCELEKGNFNTKKGETEEMSEEELNTIKTSGAHWMVGIPTVWIKIDTVASSDPNAPKIRVCVSPTQIDSTYHAYAHTNQEGDVVPYIYIDCYEGCLRRVNYTSPSGPAAMHVLTSHPNATPYTGTTKSRRGVADDHRARVRENNVINTVAHYGEYVMPIWDMETIEDRELITILLMLIGKSADPSVAFGANYCESVQTPGWLYNFGMFWGDWSWNSEVKVFGLSNFWGNTAELVQGILLNNNTLYVKPTATINSQNDDYEFYELGNYINIGTVTDDSPSTPSGFDRYGRIQTMVANQYGIFPSYIHTYGDILGYDYYTSSYVAASAIAVGGESPEVYVGAFGVTTKNVQGIDPSTYHGPLTTDFSEESRDSYIPLSTRCTMKPPLE